MEKEKKRRVGVLNSSSWAITGDERGGSLWGDGS